MRLLCIYSFLSAWFGVLGRKIAENTGVYIYIPVFLSLLLGTGLQRIKIGVSLEDEMESLGVTATEAKEYLQLHFPTIHSKDFDPGRLITLPTVCSVIIVPKDGKSVLRSSILKEILELDNTIRELSIEWERRKWKYVDICVKEKGRCFQDSRQWIKERIEELEKGELRVTYPIEKANARFNLALLSLGGVRLDENANVLSANSFRITYFLNDTEVYKDALVKRWQKHFLNQMSELNFVNIKAYKDASIASEELSENISKRVLPYFPITVCLIVAFTLISSWESNCLYSKPWIGVISATATGLSLLSSCGLLSYLGVNFRTSCVAVSFLTLGIGMDDTFVMLSAWYKTDREKSVRERLSETMAETGVAITLTSLTNVITLGLGSALSTIKGTKVFTLYASISLLFDFIYQITFVAGMLALTGKAEERGLNSFTFRPIKNSTGKAGRLCSTRTLSDCFGITHPFILFFLHFWSNLANLLTKQAAKIGVSLLYIAYLVMLVMGLTKFAMHSSLDINTVYDSYQFAYAQVKENNYRQYQHRIQIIIPEALDYADPKIQQEVEEMVSTLESHPLFSGSSLTESWLRSFTEFINDNRTSYLLTDYNMTNMETFTYILRRLFFNHPLTRLFKNDVVFDTNQTRIEACRFLLQTNITDNDNDFYKKYTDFKRMVKNEKYPLLIYNPLTLFFDSLDNSRSESIQTAAIIITTVIILSSFFLHNVISTVCVGISILSVTTGVASFLLILDIPLDDISLTMIIMICGFAVDYSAHVSYAYFSCKSSCPNERMRYAVNLVGKPIFQGGTTTILCVIILAFFHSKQLIVLVKIYSLTSILSAIHGIFFIPVILSILDSIGQSIMPKTYSLNKVKGVEEVEGAINFGMDISLPEKKNNTNINNTGVPVIANTV